MELLAHKTLLYRGSHGIKHWQVKTAGEWRELITSPALITNNGKLLVKEALLGRGITLLPTWLVVDELKEGALQQIELKDEFISVCRNQSPGIFLLYLRPRYRISKIKAAVDFIVKEVSGMK